MHLKSATSTCLGLAAALAAVAALGGCAAGPSKADDSAKNVKVLVDDATCARNRAAGTITHITGYGYSASAGQLDIFMAKELGYFDELCLKVDINASGASGQQLVASGQAQTTSLGSAADVILSAANSPNLTAVATYGDVSPFSIFANKKIKNLKDLEGGTLGYFINLTPVASAMLDAAGVDISKVKLVKMTNYDPTVVTRGQVDAIVGYASNQPEKLRAAKLPFNEFLPAEYGVSGTYNVLEMNSAFLKKHRPVAADFMRASLKALEYCLDNEKACVDTISKLAKENNQGSAFPKDQQARTWRVESGWVRGTDGGTPGVINVNAWQKEYELVQKYGNAKKLPPLDTMMDTRLVAGLYQNGQLVWPGK